MRRILLLYISIFCGITASEETNYRLPTNIVPHEYTLQITLYDDCFITSKFLGKTEIMFEVKKTTKTIILHAKNLTIVTVNVKKGDKYLEYQHNDIDDKTNKLSINMTEELPIGSDYKLTIVYCGTLSSTDMFGFYQSTYSDSKGQTHHLATTQFEQIYARRAFPCFDEPKFKAKFNLTLEYPRHLKARSNRIVKTSTVSNNNLMLENFEVTPEMSTYLLAFTISDFTATNGTNNLTIWAKPGTESNRNVTLDMSNRLLDVMDNYTGIPYRSQGLGKIDVFAIPDIAAGAMENWGIVTYREDLLLDDNVNTSTSTIEAITTTIAHEFAHSWFGNLVTMEWWSDAWLNEGFATYFQYIFVHSLKPDWSMDKKLAIEEQQEIFLFDGLHSSQPLSSNASHINTLEDIEEKFNGLTYSKGASVIRMMSGILDDKFATGLVHYLNDRKYKNAVPQNLWDAFDSLKPTLPNGTKFGEVMHNWIYKAGYPVIKVTQLEKKIAISQKRFVYGNFTKVDNTAWYVPITFTKMSDKSKFTTTKPQHWLMPNENLLLPITLKDEWVIVNNLAIGYYRVNYDDNLWERIITVLNTDLNEIPDVNRAQLLDDVFNLARASEVSYELTFKLADYLVNETNYFAWSAVLPSFEFLLRRSNSSELKVAIQDKMRILIEELYKSVPISKIDFANNTYSLTQTMAHFWACKLNNSDCVKNALEKFKSFKEKPSTNRPHSNFRHYIYCNALRYSKNPKQDWEFLWEQYNATESLAEKRTILMSLGCVNDETILLNYLKKSISPQSGIRKQDAHLVCKSVYSENPIGVAVTYTFLKQHHKEMENYYQSMNAFDETITGISNQFTNSAQINDFQQFIKNSDLSNRYKIVATKAIENALINIEWNEKFEKELRKIFKLDKSGASVMSYPLGLLFSITTITLIFNFI